MCLPCPLNTVMDMEGAAICSCLDGYFRDEQTNEGPEVNCTRELNSLVSILKLGREYCISGNVCIINFILVNFANSRYYHEH